MLCVLHQIRCDLERKLFRPGDETSEFAFGYCKSLAGSVRARMARDIVVFEWQKIVDVCVRDSLLSIGSRQTEEPLLQLGPHNNQRFRARGPGGAQARGPQGGLESAACPRWGAPESATFGVNASRVIPPPSPFHEKKKKKRKKKK